MTDGIKQENAGVVTAALLVIGDEILSGRTKDVNIGAVADHCTAIGIRLMEVRVAPDMPESIIAAINALGAGYDYLFTTGGIGPTHDDITADCVAAAFGVGIDVRADAVAMLRERYSEAELTPARLRMARIPNGAKLIENAVSKAPGFMIGNVIVMAGVPGIMRAMLDAVTSRLRTGHRVLSQTIVVHKPEGDIAHLLGQCQSLFPDVAMGSYPFFDESRYGTNIVLRSVDDARLSEAADALRRELEVNGCAV
ncbi:MAG: molybdopterin-binding protein [Hyphomicrobiales bacterium]|nr:molybdopterin-binding protein [Hyphomicrobiales bacterium]